MRYSVCMGRDQSNSKKDILVVDDDDFVLSIIEKILDDHPEYNPTVSRSAESAFEELKKQVFDLIITDIIMPEKDGIQFIEELRKEDKSTPVIAITGGDAGAADNAHEYGNFAGYFANETLIKPFGKDDLYTAIDMAMDNNHGDALQYL